MEHLKEGETYKIESVYDLFNCPVNMMDECIEGIKDIFIKRLEISKKKGYPIKIVKPYFELTNDGENMTHIEAKELNK